MKKTLSALLFICGLTAMGQTTPYSQIISNVNGIQVSPNTARICPPTGNVTFKAFSVWPFGIPSVSNNYGFGPYLHVTNGSTAHLPCGSVTDFDSIRIDNGGTLIIDDYNGTGAGTQTGSPWTIIGCKGKFVVDGLLLCQNGNHPGGNWQLMEPDSTGSLTIPNANIGIVQNSGGSGGNGGNSHTVNGGGGTISGGVGGMQYAGNGGGGGGGATTCSQCCLSPGGPGGNANDTTSGYGGHVGNTGNNTAGVSQYGLDGNYGLIGPTPVDYNYGSPCWAASNGGSGGFKGKHGGLLFIKALQSITGSGTINLSGQNGGNGGSCDIAQATGNNDFYAGQGGGGGGGAGGSGGYLYLKYSGATPTVNINVNAGNGGLGGIPTPYTYFYGISPGTNGTDGQAGVNGAVNLLSLGGGYSYQWRRNLTNIGGATNSTYTTTLVGLYDCKITDPSSTIHWTSGASWINQDTVYTDNQPVANITSAPNAICSGATATLTAQSVNGQTYQWYNGFFPVIGATSPTFTTSVAGNYQVETNNSCNNPTMSTQTVTLVVNPNPTASNITYSPNDTVCQGNSIVLTSSVNTNITWSNGPTTATNTVTTSGNYSVTVTNTVTGCSTTSTQSVTVLPASVNAGADVSLSCGQFFQMNPTINPASVSSVSWSPSTYLSATNVLNPVCTPEQATTYTVNVNFTNGCNATDVINMYNSPITNLEICMVAVDTGSTHNIVFWDTTGMAMVDTFLIQRELMTNVYTTVGKVAYGAIPEFHDMAANPNGNTYRYKMGVIDTCGNRHDTITPYHNTVYMVQTNGSFDWSAKEYKIENIPTPVSYYVLERDSLSNGIWDSIKSCPGTQFTLTDNNWANQQYARWRITTIWTTPRNCDSQIPAAPGSNPNTFAVIKKSRSNINNNRVVTTGIQDQNNFNFNIYPNPAKDEIFIQLGNVKGNVQIEICDVTGRVVERQTINDKPATINCSSLSNGVYFVNVMNEGKRMVKKIVIEK